MTGNEIIRDGSRIVRNRGGVFVNFNYHRQMPQGAKGWPDVVVFYEGVEYLVEVKGDKDALRKDQIDFFWKVRPHLGEHIRYVLADDRESFYMIVEGHCREVEIPEKWLDQFENGNRIWQ